MANDIRVKYIDAELSRRVHGQLKAALDDSRRLIASEPAKLRQRRESMLAREMAMVASYGYALGQPLLEVGNHLRTAAQAKLKVFELREESEGFPSELVTIGVDASTQQPIDIEREWRTDRDYSLTNARAGVDGIYMALASGQPLIAQRLAQLIGDPPDAPYIGEESDVCTPDDQHIAYAVKHYLLENRIRAEVELSMVGGHDPRTAAEAELVGALMEGERNAFTRALAELLKWHAAEAKKKRNSKDTSFFLNLPALGLSALALRDGVVTPDGLPREVPHYPVEMLTA